MPTPTNRSEQLDLLPRVPEQRTEPERAHRLFAEMRAKLAAPTAPPAPDVARQHAAVEAAQMRSGPCRRVWQSHLWEHGRCSRCGQPRG